MLSIDSTFKYGQNKILFSFLINQLIFAQYDTVQIGYITLLPKYYVPTTVAKVLPLYRKLANDFLSPFFLVRRVRIVTIMRQLLVAVVSIVSVLNFLSLIL